MIDPIPPVPMIAAVMTEASSGAVDAIEGSSCHE
jgi:hypothetical protein